MITLLRSLIAKATPGDWHKRRDFEDDDCAFISGKGGYIAKLDGLANRHENAAYIAAANPDNITALLDLIDTCEKAFEVLVRNGISDDIAVEALQRIREMKGDA
jgi:hypothetical protein